MPRAAPLYAAVSLVLAALVGALLLSVVVAPITFGALSNDHAAAGQIAGRVFSITYDAAAVVFLGAFLLSWKTPRARVTTGLGFLSAAVLALLIVPMVRAHGEGWPGSFAALHLTAGALHLVVLIAAAVSAWLMRER